MLRRLMTVAILLLGLLAPADAAKLYISEYAAIGTARGNVAQIAVEPVIVDQTPVDFTAGVTLSAVFNAATQYVRIMCDARCAVVFGAAPTATTSNKTLPADTPEYFAVQAGHRISVIANP